MSGSTAKLLELLVIVVAIFGFGFWELYKLRRERKGTGPKERSAFARGVERATDDDDTPSST